MKIGHEYETKNSNDSAGKLNLVVATDAVGEIMGDLAIEL